MPPPTPQLDHEQLDVYQVAIKFAAWSFALVADLSGPARHARDQLIRASQSIPLNIAEGNAKRDGADRRRYFETARGSAAESAAILDLLMAMNVRAAEEVSEGKGLARRLVQMLVKLAPPDSMTRTRTGTTQGKPSDKRPVFRAGRRYPSGGRRAG